MSNNNADDGFQGDDPSISLPEPELTAEEQQVVREVVIQVNALLNDSRRANDEGIWKAILSEPPADQAHLRSELAQKLEPKVRPMAENGSFQPSVVSFLGDWFHWHELKNIEQPEPEDQTFNDNETQQDADVEDSQPQMVSFWPAVVGWIVALAVLAALFDGMLGG